MFHGTSTSMSIVTNFIYVDCVLNEEIKKTVVFNKLVKIVHTTRNTMKITLV